MIRSEVMRDSLADVLGIEQHALQRIERQTRDERVRNFCDACKALKKIEAVLKSHIGELEPHLSEGDGSLEARLKRTAISVAGSVAGIYDRFITNEPVSRGLRGDYVALNLAVISYGMLHTAALTLVEKEIASMAERHMADLTPLIVELSGLIPFVLAEELAGCGQIEDAVAARQSVAQFRQAWSHEVTTGV